MDEALTYKEYADLYFTPHFGEVRKKLELRNNVFSKLEYLFRQLREYESKRLTIAPYEQTPIKTSINNYYALNQEVNDYVIGKIFDRDLHELRSTFDDKYTKYIEDDCVDNSRDVKKRRPSTKYLEDNQTSLPHEVLEAFKMSGVKDIRKVPDQCIPGICYGMILVEEEIRKEIEVILSNNALSKEEFELIEERYGGRIQWKGTVKTLAKFTNLLVYSKYIEIKDTAPVKANLTYLHFHVKGKNGEESYSKRTLLDRMKDTYMSAVKVVDSFKSLFPLSSD